MTLVKAPCIHGQESEVWEAKSHSILVREEFKCWKLYNLYNAKLKILKLVIGPLHPLHSEQRLVLPKIQ